jgi:hypothetical protein
LVSLSAGVDEQFLGGFDVAIEDSQGALFDDLLCLAGVWYQFIILLLGELGAVGEILGEFASDFGDLLDDCLEELACVNFTGVFIDLAFVDGVADGFEFLDDAGHGGNIEGGREGHHDGDGVVVSEFSLDVFDDGLAIGLKEDGTLTILL